MKKSVFDEFENDRMIKDPANYKWGFIYFNRKDGRVMVPKYARGTGWGWTLNFGNFYAYLLILGFILAILIFKYLG